MYSKGSHNTSADMLRAQKSNTAIDDLDGGDLYKQERRRAKRENLTHLYKNDYKPAKYSLACEYRDALSYKKKMSNGSYVRILAILEIIGFVLRYRWIESVWTWTLFLHRVSEESHLAFLLLSHHWRSQDLHQC